MRIRKHAAKLLLGSACPPPQQYSPPPPPPPPADDGCGLQCAADHGLFHCQLNCSPWDVLDLDDSNHFYFQHHHQQEEEEGGDERKGIMGNVLGFGDEEGIFGISEALTKSVVVAEPYFNFEEEDDDEDGVDRKNNVKKRRRRKKKEKWVDGHENGDHCSKSSSVDNAAGSVAAASICKKNDGKGWHCSRPANPNHTLCDHHLTQLKSYSSTRYNRHNHHHHHNNNVAAAAAAAADQSELSDAKPDPVPPVKHRRRKTKAAAAAASVKSDGDGYYYYSGFGLSRGKKSRSSFRNEGAKVEETVEEDVSAGHNGSDSGDGSDGPIAGGDLDDDTDDADDADAGGDGDGYRNPVGNVDNSKGRIRRKKRGRKPIKARSLKSLL